MHQQLVIVLLVGLAASAYGLDLSHTNKRSTEFEPRIVSFLSDMYAQVIYPPLNHVVTSLALMSAQMLAGVGINGLPAPGGRSSQVSQAELRGFWDGLWNDAMKPPLENALSGMALMAAQMLAGIGINGVNLGIGKRDLTEAEMRGISDAFNEAFNHVFTNVIQKPMEDALSASALMLAQVLAGAGTNGISLSSLFGKRDLSEAEMRGISDAFNQAFNHVFTNVIQKPMEDALSASALMLAQVLAGAGTNGINLSSLFGKRDLSELTGHEAELRGIFNNVGTSILNGLQGVWTNVLQNPLENFMQNSALNAAQVLAIFGTNGVNLGKRDAEPRGPIISGLVDHASDLFATQVKPLLENALNAAALHLAGVLANVSQNLGRR